jgi:hypothetical protein
MIGLHTLQQSFAAETLGPTPTDLRQSIFDDGIDPASRLQLHQNNTLISLTGALNATFPTVARLVGDDFFGFLARRYVQSTPPQQGPLFTYGESFAAFIETFDAAQGLPYLPDVARLEWARNSAYYAADAEPIDVVDLANLIFRLHPSHRLVASNFPIQEIWRANQPEEEPSDITLDAGVHMLIVRPQFYVEHHVLDGGTFGFLVALAMGQTIDVATSAAQTHNASFDVGSAISSLLLTNVFTSFQTPDEEYSS